MVEQYTPLRYEAGVYRIEPILGVKVIGIGEDEVVALLAILNEVEFCAGDEFASRTRSSRVRR